MNMKRTKYKTMLCKNFEFQSGCSYDDKCQFAHGVTELNSFGVILTLTLATRLPNGPKQN